MSKELELLQAISRGNKLAFRTVYDMYSAKVFNTAISYIQNQQLAEEITQDVFLKVYNNASKFRGDSSFSTWVYRITINTSLNYIKSQKRKSNSPLEFSPTAAIDFEHPGVIMENKENAKMLFSVIEGLSENQKTAFVLSYIENLPRQKVADIMEISLKATESLLQRGKKTLREKLENVYPDRRKRK